MDEKKQAKWELIVDVAVWTLVSGLIVRYNLSEVCPTFLNLSNAEQFLLYYGWKQFATDKGARKKDEKLTDQEHVDIANAKWDIFKTGEVPVRTGGGGGSVTKFMAELIASGLSEDLVRAAYAKSKTKK